MGELTTEEHRGLILQNIEELNLSKTFPDTVKRLMATPEWKEVIEEVYIDNFARDMVRNYDEWEEDQKKDFDAEYKMRSRFINTMQIWAEKGDQAQQQILRLQDMLREIDKAENSKEPTINVK